MKLRKLEQVFYVASLMGIMALWSCGNTSGTETAADTGDTAEVAAAEESIPEETTTIASPRKQVEGEAGGVTIKMDYGSPGVKGRQIWGGLEDYGKVWRAGANETTNIEFSGDVTIGGTKVPAGKYGFFIIPNEDSDWVVIINTAWSREEHGIWGADKYSEENDIVRVSVTPELSEEVTERLQYSIADNAIHFAWEKAHLTIPVAVSK